jgi:hypothetical protein
MQGSILRGKSTNKYMPRQTQRLYLFVDKLSMAEIAKAEVTKQVCSLEDW